MLGDRWAFETSPRFNDAEYMASIYNIAPQVKPAVEANKVPGESYFDAFLRVANAVVLTDAQRRLLNIQIQRAAQGLPPLDSSQYGLGVSVGVSPEITRIAWVVGLGLLGVLVLGQLSRRR
jgi:hypothetical protein